MNNRVRNALVVLLLMGSQFLLVACVVVGQHKGSDEEIARANVDLAAEYYRQGRMDIALSNVKKALRADPESVDAHVLIALIYNQIEEKSLAREHFESAVEYVQSDSVAYGQVHNNFGAFLCANDQYIEAQEHFSLAVENKLYQTPEAAYENAGLCALNKPDADQARLFFNKALKINFNLPRALIEMVKLDVEVKKYADAKIIMQRFHKNNETSSQSLWLAFQIENGLGNKDKAQILLAQLKEDFPDSQEAKGDSLVLDK